MIRLLYESLGPAGSPEGTLGILKKYSGFVQRFKASKVENVKAPWGPRWVPKGLGIS